MARGGVAYQGADTRNIALTTPGEAGQALISNGADADPTFQDVSATSSPPPATSLNTYLVSGGQVTWDSGYTFRVSAASYYINGVLYTSIEQTVTLDAADGTYDRLDVIVLDTVGTVQAITGVASSTPSEPSADPASYVKLALVLVSASTTQPVSVSNVLVYAENTGSGGGEWNWTTSGSGFAVNSTTTPHAGTKDIEGTTVAAGAYAQGEKGTGSIDPNAYTVLVLFLRSKATWNPNRGLLVTLRSAGVLVGASVQIRRSGTFGFDSANTSDYQQVAIPITAFAISSGSTINQVRLEDFGGSIGFFIDDISFQVTGTTPATGGITQAEADARYAPLGSAYAVVGSADATLPNERRLTAGSAVSLTDGGAGSTLTVAVATDGISNTLLANMAQATIKGRAAAAGTGDPTDLTANEVSTILDSATDPFVRTSAGGGSYTDEQAQDAVGTILTDTATIDFTYTDGTPSITADVKAASITEAMQVLADNTTQDVSTTKHGYAPKAPNDATKFLDGTGAWDTVKDSDLSTSDITTNDVSTSKHGFAPKLPNDATKYLDGTGAYTVPTGGSASDSFKTIQVSGQSDVVADSSTDTLTLVAGSNVTITTNAGTDAITITATGGGGGAPTASSPSGGFYLYDGSQYYAPIYPVTPPNNASYAWINQGSSSVNTNGGAIFLKSGSAATSWAIRKKSAPSPPYTVSVMFIPRIFSGTNNRVGPIWRQSSDGKLITCEVSWSGGPGAQKFVINKWNGPTSFSAAYSPTFSSNHVSYGSPYFMRLEDDNTNRKVYTSFDGQNWELQHTVGRTDFLTADEVGFAADDTAGITILSWVEA